ncbi:DUF4331 domain-containing protein [Catenulispora yoronensis]|uniref:DUF4331 domain-containing protein n=1 Tax=Catenulispora yoronensis TaxID=450799 RepID=A0ABP5GWW8_9ACTN
MARARRLTRILPGIAGAASVAVLSAGMSGGAPTAAASSHREAPLIAGDPQVDNTDVYAFSSPDRPDTVTFIANFSPFQEPVGGPNFYPWATDAQYDIHVDSHGTGKPDLTFRYTFTNEDHRGTDTFLYDNGPVASLDDPHLLFRQHYKLEEIKADGTSTVLVADGIAAPSDTGAASMPDYGKLRNQAVTGFTGGQTLVGQAADPFFLDLRVFDLLYGKNLSETGHNTLAGYNVNTIVLQVPKSELALNHDPARNPVIGTWSTAQRRTMQLSPGTQTAAGDWVQVSRLGNPLVNEVVVPAGLKDAFNGLTPDKDHTIAPVVQRVLDPEVPKLIQGIYGIPAPAAPRTDLVEIFLQGIAKATGGPIQADLNSQLLNADADHTAFTPAEELRLNLGVPSTARPNRLGVLGGDLQGFPNGRRLGDDVVDIAVQAMEGAARTGKIVAPLANGDGVNRPDRMVTNCFPYLALPYNQAVNNVHGQRNEAPAHPQQHQGPQHQGPQHQGPQHQGPQHQGAPHQGGLLGGLLG